MAFRQTSSRSLYDRRTTFILNQFIEAIEIEKPDAIVIAGDLYDRAVPPTEAVALLDEVLEKIVMDMKIPVIAIGGNHDSPGRLHFGSSLMQKNGYFIAGQVAKEIEPVILHGRIRRSSFSPCAVCGSFCD